MFNYDCIAKEDRKEHNKYWPEMPEYPCRIFIVGGFGSGKNALLKVINHKPDTDEILFYAENHMKQNINY